MELFAANNRQGTRGDGTQLNDHPNCCLNDDLPLTDCCDWIAHLLRNFDCEELIEGLLVHSSNNFACCGKFHTQWFGRNLEVSPLDDQFTDQQPKWQSNLPKRRLNLTYAYRV